MFESVACAAPRRSPPKSGPAVGQSDQVSAPQTLPAEKYFLHVVSARSSCFRASAAATSPQNSRSPRNGQPSRAATHRLQQLRLRVLADHQNRTSASPAPAKENQCTKTRSSLTLWESRRFKSAGNRFSGENLTRGARVPQNPAQLCRVQTYAFFRRVLHDSHSESARPGRMVDPCASLRSVCE